MSLHGERKCIENTRYTNGKDKRADQSKNQTSRFENHREGRYVGKGHDHIEVVEKLPCERAAFYLSQMHHCRKYLGHCPPRGLTSGLLPKTPQR